MLNKDDILSLKLSSRFCRRKLCDLPDIKAIVEECSEGLGMKAPELICCETLTRSFNAFLLMGEPYILYDACLIEGRYGNYRKENLLNEKHPGSKEPG